MINRPKYQHVFLGVVLATLTACASHNNSNRLQPEKFSKPVARETWLAPENETADQRNQRMAWWRQARFGLFIHWGVYSVPGGEYLGKPASAEWIMLRSQIPVADYKAYANDFNPQGYDPEAWVLAAKNAGMKYIVITAKHHDGFALYDSKVTDWDVVDATPYGKDLLKPLAEAARKHDMKLGFYYSQAQDWVHPGGAKHKHVQWDIAQQGSYDQYISKIAAPQIKEILSNYGDIAVLWWDTPVGVRAHHVELFQQHLALQPAIITNNRLGGGALGDTVTPEQFIPALGIPGHDWETCMTMNNSWGFRSNDHHWKSAKDLIRKLGDIASKGGNFLLNVGPTPQGNIPEQSLKLLKDIGQWMKVNSESIYGTEQSVLSFIDWGRVTQKTLENGDTRLYLHVWDWPQNGRLSLPLKNKVSDSFLLSNQSTIKVVDNKLSLELLLPTLAPDQVSSVIVVDIEGSPQLSVSRFNQSGEQGQFTLTAKQGMLHNHLGTHMRLDESGTRPKISHWRTKQGKRAEGWIEWELEIKQTGQYAVTSLISNTTMATEPMKAVLEYLGNSADSLKSVYNKRGRAILPKGQAVQVATALATNQSHIVKLGQITVTKPGIYRIGLLPVAAVKKASNEGIGMGLSADGYGWIGPDVHNISLTPVVLRTNN